MEARALAMAFGPWSRDVHVGIIDNGDFPYVPNGACNWPKRPARRSAFFPCPLLCALSLPP